jgi:hypothetical protein
MPEDGQTFESTLTLKAFDLQGRRALMIAARPRASIRGMVIRLRNP